MLSCIVPRHTRSAWRSKWLALLASARVLYERGEVNRKEWWAIGRGCLTDAFVGSRYSFRFPRFILVSALAALALIGFASHGFRVSRHLFDPLPVADPDRLVAIRYTGSAGQPAGVPPRLLPVWRANSSLLTSIAAYWHRPYSPIAHVTTNFFALLGTHPARGRLLQPEDRDSAVVSPSAWREASAGAVPELGSRIAVAGKTYTVAGLLPDSFWAISPRIAVWVPLDLEPQPEPGLPVLIGALGRMKPGASMSAVRGDLLHAAQSGRQRLPRAPEVIAFTGVPGRRWLGYLYGISFAVCVAGVLIARQQGLSFRNGWRYWRFLLAKVLLLTAIPALTWIESGLTGALFTIPFLAACAFAFWWSFVDQRQRCPECLERLALPVTIGSWSSVLEPVTTEFLCEFGHGSLCVPETERGEPDRWTALDASWRDLFEKVTPP
jgi:hypothetical protein